VALALAGSKRRPRSRGGAKSNGEECPLVAIGAQSVHGAGAVGKEKAPPADEGRAGLQNQRLRVGSTRKRARERSLVQEQAQDSRVRPTAGGANAIVDNLKAGSLGQKPRRHTQSTPYATGGGEARRSGIVQGRQCDWASVGSRCRGVIGCAPEWMCVGSAPSEPRRHFPGTEGNGEARGDGQRVVPRVSTRAGGGWFQGPSAIASFEPRPAYRPGCRHCVNERSRYPYS
jgi:hypothetical protein